VELASCERDPDLRAEANLYARARAIDLADLFRDLARSSRDPRVLDLFRRADELREDFSAVDDALFSRVRSRLLAKSWSAGELRFELDRFTAYRRTSTGKAHYGFDGLDLLLDGIFGTDATPDPIEPPDHQMVHYEPVPARVILDLIDHVNLNASDVFYDLGSGLGRVVFLVNLLTGVRCRGVEIRPDLCAASGRVAEQLGLGGVDIVEVDARQADYRDGTVFFMFTPFRGALLQAVLARLHAEARRRPIVVCTYGSCTRHVFEVPWLTSVTPDAHDDYKLAIFRSESGNSLTSHISDI
jgi:hypothetical protein